MLKLRGILLLIDFFVARENVLLAEDFIIFTTRLIKIIILRYKYYIK